MKNNSQNNKYQDLWRICESDLYQHWLGKAQNFNQQLFEGDNNEVENVTDIIEDFREVFNKINNDINMNSDANLNKRRNYCKALLNYCEVTQDWRDLGNWIKAEIQNFVGNDGAWLYFGLGRYLEETGELKESLDYHQKGIEASKETDNKNFLALNHLGAGITLQRSEQYQQAEWHLNQALAFFEAENNSYQQANTLLNLGSLYDRDSRPQKSINCYQKSFLILKKINYHFDLGRILYSLGIAYLRINEINKAEKTFSEAKSFCQETENLYFLALTIYGIGWLEYLQGNYTRSRQTLESAIAHLKQAKNSEFEKKESKYAIQLSFPEIEGNIFLVAAAAYSKGDNPDFEDANKYLDLAENSYNQLDYPEDKLNNVLSNRARLYKYKKEWDKATITFWQLLDRGKKRSSANTVSDAAIHLIWIYYQRSASIIEWIKLIRKLGLIGILGLVQGLFNRAKRYFEVNIAKLAYSSETVSKRNIKSRPRVG
ncbi:MAG: tetratricopeptide repeat protein [Okeania sp. SIO3B5]|uniref:tetratricopeptide repeat protein n=1 Tax=Okeania sp. SIO3B5 TaxID=2607811 RepID=UPI0013FF2781|nr:tetratricopeptide repeat protein [Okeania sp. SIO3B5]NEO54528.1 tetratricopeptide repeat protein [Okeania sp. SIO3B5]